MIRTTLLFVTSAAILVLAFLAYLSFIAPAPDAGGESGANPTPIPSAQYTPKEEAINVSNAEMKARIGGGQVLELTIYDPRSKRATGNFRCQTWKKAPDSDEEFIVEAPEISLLMPSGLVASIRADSGVLWLGGVQERRMEPRSGTLEGHARITIDRDASPDRAPAAERPEDVVTIDLESLRFDLEAGRLESREGVRLVSDAFELSGVGLSLVWNTALNRLETLTIDQGDLLTLFIDRSLSSIGGGESPASAPSPAATVQPATAVAAASKPASDARPAGPLTSYRCTLADHVVVDQINEHGQRVGGLTADLLELTFDVGGKATRYLDRFQGGPRPATAPATAGAHAATEATTASAPTRKPRDQRAQLRVAWRGALRLGPFVEDRPPAQPRRHIRAVGDEIHLQFADRSLIAGEFEYHDETGSVWLRPPAHKRLEIMLGTKLHAQADEIFLDRPRGIVKLIGKVDLDSINAGGAPGTSISAGLWAELRLRPEKKSPAAQASRSAGLGDELIDAMSRSAPLESATFVGDVRVALGDQALAADRLEAFFKPAAGDEKIEKLLERAAASGNVRLRAGLSTRPGWLDVLAAKWQRPLAPLGDPLDRAAQAIDAGWIDMKFGVDQDQNLYPSEIEARGDVVLRDRGRRFAARARHLTARGSADSRLDYAAIEGTIADPAKVRAESFDVAGQRIEVTPADETVRVPGRARLTFMAERGLRGERSGRAQPVNVTCDRELTVDNQRNLVVFVGHVDARSGAESLRGDELTLRLVDVADAPPRVAPSISDWLGEARTVITQQAELRARAAAAARGAEGANAPATAPLRKPPFQAGRDRNAEPTHKEPVELIATNAAVVSEISVPGDPRPLLHQSIAAPELKIDIRKRIVRTTGETSLLNIDRRLPRADESAQPRGGAAGDGLGLPSALVARGPSQTAIRCSNSMIYAMGADGPARRDSVVLDGNVLFRHAAGREMKDIDAMFPRVADKEEFLKRLGGGRMTGLACSRMECTFETGSGSGAGDPVVGGLDASQPSMRLALLAARGGVSLVDVQESERREVTADQVEFERDKSLIRILGVGAEPAHLVTIDLKTNKLSFVDSREIRFDLKTNTIQSDRMTGESVR